MHIVCRILPPAPILYARNKGSNGGLTWGSELHKSSEFLGMVNCVAVPHAYAGIRRRAESTANDSCYPREASHGSKRCGGARRPKDLSTDFVTYSHRSRNDF